MFTKKINDLIKKTSKLSFFIFINKPIGFLRDILQTQYFGLGLISDAYLIAWKIPNIFRRIFGEGLLSNILLPDLIKLEKTESAEFLNKTVSCIIIIMQSIITVICILIFYYSLDIITWLSPGSLDRIAYGANMLRILIFFTFFMSFSAILSTTVQLRDNFYIGPQSQLILNILFCIELYFAQQYSWNYSTLSIFIAANGIVILLVHLLTFFYYNFYFSLPDRKSISYVISFFKKFTIALSSSLLLESSSIITIPISSYLSPGLLSLFELLLTLIRVPQQVFGSSLASTSNIAIINAVQNKTETLSDEIYPLFKFFFILSITLFFLIYTFSDIFFQLFFFFCKIKSDFIIVASNLFLIMAGSLFPALANRILLNIYYAHEKLLLPTVITFFVTLFYNLFICLFIKQYQLYAFGVGYFLLDWIRFFILYGILYYQYDFNLFYKKNSIEYKKKLYIAIFFLFLFLLIEKILLFLIVKNFFLKRQICIITSSYLSYLIYNQSKKYNILK